MTVRVRITRALSLLTLAATLVCGVRSAQAGDVSFYDPKKLVTPPIHKVTPAKPERFTMPNGTVVFLLENHELPVVSGVAYFKSSPALVPDDRVGLASLAGEVMRSGGTATHPGDALDDRLAAIGASINTGVGADQANGGFRCLTENTSEVIGTWADVLRHPVFPDDKIELAKVGLRRSIASRNDEMIGLLVRTATQAVYGKQNKYAREPEYSSVEPITKADCLKLHAAVFVPERMVLAIYGDFKSAEMKTLLMARFGDWKASGTAAPVAVATPRTVAPKLLFAPKDDVTQSGIVVAQPGSRADDPDYAPLQVLEQGLGGGFQSRLFNKIRTQRGLAYATGANAGADFHRPGVFLAYSLTKSESTMVALRLLREEVARVTQAAFTNDELEAAKQSVVNGFVFNFEDPSQVLFRSAFYELNGYPLDFLLKYQKDLDAVTAQSVLEAARRKITPAAQVAIIVGREKDFDARLESAGLPVERVDITIPPPPRQGGEVKATPEARAQAQAWLAGAAKLAGGSAAWMAVKTVKLTTEASVSIQGQNISFTAEETWQLPNKQVAVQKLPFGEVKQGFDGRAGWMSGMGQLQDNPKAAEAVAKEAERSLWRLLGASPPVPLVALAAAEKADGKDYRAAVVEGAKQTDLTVLFDADGRLAGVAYHDEGSPQMPAARVQELLGDWRAEGTLSYPHSMKVLRDGKVFLESKVTAIVLNPPVTEAMFAKPAK